MAWQRTDVLKVRNVDVGGVRTSYQFCVIQVDTASDLPALNQTNWVFEIGSLAYVIDTASQYKIKSDGTWVLQEAGTAGYTKEEIDQLIQDTKDYADGEIVGAILDLDVPAVGGTTRYIYQISQADGKIVANSYLSDSIPTAGSTKLVQSAGIKTYVDDQVATKASITDVFGVGSNPYIPDASDLNTYTQAGVYIRQFSSGLSDFSNLPMDGTTYSYQPFKLVVEYLNSPNNILQTLIPTYSNCGFFKRCRIFGASGTWQAWKYFEGV